MAHFRCTLLHAVLLVVMSASLAWAQPATQKSGVRDFVEYWSASRLLLSGGNPYSPSELLALQRSAGWPGVDALIMWNPPWTLPFTLPYGWLSFDLAQFAWLFTQLLLILVSIQALANLYGGGSSNCRIAWCVALSFVPTVFVLIIGQISPLVLAGIAGFLVFEKKEKWLAAGAVLTLVAIKPHLLYLFWIVWFLWICRYRRWRVALGAALALVIAGSLPLYFDSQIYDQYLALHALDGIVKPLDWLTPTLRNVFRLWFDLRDPWLQCLPTMAGLVWLGYYWQRHKTQWQWAERLPLVLLVSVSTSFFAWTYDQVVLLPAFIEVAAWIKRTETPWYRSWTALCYIAINGAHIVMRFRFADEFVYLWLAPALTVNYVIYQFEKRRQTVNPPASFAAGG